MRSVRRSRLQGAKVKDSILVSSFQSALRDSHTASKVRILRDRYILSSMDVWLREVKRIDELSEERIAELNGVQT